MSKVGECGCLGGQRVEDSCRLRSHWKVLSQEGFEWSLHFKRSLALVQRIGSRGHYGSPQEPKAICRYTKVRDLDALHRVLVMKMEVGVEMGPGLQHS